MEEIIYRKATVDDCRGLSILHPMEIKKAEIDKGQAFDFGRTSEIYAQYRDIYPECMFQKLADLELGIQGQKILDFGIQTGL